MPSKFGSQFWFTSSLFEIEQGEDEETNPLCFGRQLSNWLRIKLREKGYDVEEVIAEDWGWCVMCSRKPFMLWVGCVSMHDYEHTRPKDPLPKGCEVTWTCSVVAEIGFLQNLFKRIDVDPTLNQLGIDIKHILRAEKNIVLTSEP